MSFDAHANAEIYNKHSRVGLSIIRPNLKQIRLNRIPANDLTIFYPFVVPEKEYDEPNSVALEYLYMSEQEIKVQR